MKQIECDRIEHQMRIKQLQSEARRMAAQQSRKWEPAPRDPGIRPEGIRDRAIKGIRK